MEMTFHSPVLVRYRKQYTRENSLIALQIWERHQCQLLRETLGDVVPLSIFDVSDGVAAVYYREDITQLWETLILAKATSDPAFVTETMRHFGEHLDTLEILWKKGALASVEKLAALADLAAYAWVGVSISYFLPSMSILPADAQALGMSLRERSVDFLDRTDRVIQNTLHSLYPELGELIKYLALEDLQADTLSITHETLQERQRHYIYFGFEIYSHQGLSEFLGEHSLSIEEESVPNPITEVAGQIAMNGRVRGRVRVLRKKSEIPRLQPGEVLVTAMTTPDYLPAMQRAAAFVTDEGGIMCHAAIVAREFGKPCLVGTRFATQVFRDGELVEVDADAGVVRRLL